MPIKREEDDQQGPLRSEITANSGRQPPFLDGGTLASAWLSERSGGNDAGPRRVEWQFAQKTGANSQDSEDYRLSELGLPLKVFPACIVAQEQPAQLQPSMQDVYASSRFFSEQKPDVFLPNDVLVDSLLGHGHLDNGRESRSGNLLAANPGYIPEGKTLADPAFDVLAFATGENSNELNVLHAKRQLKVHKNSRSRSLGTTAGDMTFMARINTTYASAAPILQVESMPHRKGTTFATRTGSSVTIAHLLGQGRYAKKFEASDWTQPQCFGPESFGGQVPVDICLSPHPSRGNSVGRCLAVDYIGGLWQIKGTKGSGTSDDQITSRFRSSVDHLRQGNPHSERSAFARINYGESPHIAIVALEDIVRRFDLHEPRADTTLYRMPEKGGRILDVSKLAHGAAHIPVRAVLTTHEILWLDIRKAGPPLQRYKHRRDDDSTLVLTETILAGGVCHMVLWSRTRALASVFAFSACPPIQMLVKPYTTMSPTPDFRRSGLSLYTAQLRIDAQGNSDTAGDASEEKVIMLELGADGSIFQRQFRIGSREMEDDGEEEENVPGQSRDWDNEVANLEKERPDEPLTKLEVQKHKVRNLRQVYEKIYNTQPTLHPSEPFPDDAQVSTLRLNSIEGEPPALYIPLELASTIRPRNGENDYQTVEPHRGTFTSPKALSRSDLSDEAFTDAPHSRAIDELARRCHTSSTRLSGTEAVDDMLGLLETFNFRYGLTSNERSQKSEKVRAALDFASEQLALDLALSYQAFSPVAPEKPNPDAVDEDMAARYESVAALPPITFGYFKPKALKPGLDLGGTPAARALLSEWKLGADVEKRPPYIDPYDEKSRERRTAAKQLGAYKERLAKGKEVSASQPMPSRTRERKPQKGGRASAKEKGKGKAKEAEAIPLEGDELETPRQTQVRFEETVPPQRLPNTALRQEADARSPGPASSQVLPSSAIPTSSFPLQSSQLPFQSQTQTMPMPFSQVLPGAHGGRPVKKKKRTGGF